MKKKQKCSHLQCFLFNWLNSIVDAFILNNHRRGFNYELLAHRELLVAQLFFWDLKLEKNPYQLENDEE